MNADTLNWFLPACGHSKLPWLETGIYSLLIYCLTISEMRGCNPYYAPSSRDSNIERKRWREECRTKLSQRLSEFQSWVTFSYLPMESKPPVWASRLTRRMFVSLPQPKIHTSGTSVTAESTYSATI